MLHSFIPCEGPANDFSEGSTVQKFRRFQRDVCQGLSQLLILEMVIPPFTGNPHNGNINPYYWFDDQTMGFWTPAQVLFAQKNPHACTFTDLDQKHDILRLGCGGMGWRWGLNTINTLGESLQKLFPKNAYIWFDNLDYPPRTFRWFNKTVCGFLPVMAASHTWKQPVRSWGFNSKT